MSEGAPNPTLRRYGLTVVFPFVIDEPDEGRGAKALRRYHEALREMRGERAPKGFSVRSPEDLAASHLGRWFLREVRCLFGGEPAPGETAEDDPSFRWLRFGELTSLVPGFREGAYLRVAMVSGPSRKDVKELKAVVLPAPVKVEASAILSEAGAIFILLRVQAGPGDHLTLAQAMSLTHYASYSDDASKVAVILSSEAIRDLPRDEIAAGEVVDLAPDVAGQTLAIAPVADIPRARLKGLRTLVAALLDPILEAVGRPRVQFAARGKVPVMSTILLPFEEGTEDIDLGMEWLCARFQRHPAEARTLPPERIADGGPLIREVTVSGSQKFLLTTEGMLALGRDRVPFDREWPDRVAGDYFLAFLLALHQTVVAQDIAWRSFARTSGAPPGNEVLVDRFLRFDTRYNFERISSQANIQALYSAARETLGARDTIREVREELTTWSDREQRYEQGALNSLAFVAGLVSVVSLFIGLNFTVFDRDSEVGPLSPKGLWFWIPLAAVACLFFKGRVRRHLLTAGRYLLSGRRDRP